MKYLLLTLFIVNINCMSNKCAVPETLSKKAIAELNTVLQNEQKFIKVHAAEFLLWLDLNQDDVKNIFLKENEEFGNEPKYRIGIWRVLAQASAGDEKQKWTEKIMNVFIDTSAPDRIHAAETLAKLKTSPMTRYYDISKRTLADTNSILSVYTKWATSYTSVDDAALNKKDFINYLFNSDDTTVRKISAYVLAKSKNLTPQEWEHLADKALAEPVHSPLKQTYLNTAFVTFTGADDGKADQIKKELTEGYLKFNAEQRISLSQSLADKGGCDDIPILESFLNNENAAAFYDEKSSLAADVRAFAAYGILNIKKKK